MSRLQHGAWFRQVSYQHSATLNVDLPREDAHPGRRLLLVVSGEAASSESFSALRTTLAEAGFAVLGLEETQEFQAQAEQAQDLTRAAFRAWARARFATDLLATARVQQSSREVSGQELSDPSVREAVKRMVRAAVRLEIEILNLRSGRPVATVFGEGVDLAADQTRSRQRAFGRAATDVATKLHQQLPG